MSDLPYRPCVGVVLANEDGLVFTGERADFPGAWQLPQGGIDAGETPQSAALRELEEETGVAPGKVTVEAEHPDWIRYDLPEELVGKALRGKWRGQDQKWFLLQFHGQDTDIDLAFKDKEFARWRWATVDDVLSDIVPFKRDVYRQVFAVFRDSLA